MDVDIRECLIGMTQYYMEQIIDGIANETIDVESIDRVWNACVDLLLTPPDGDERGSWLYRLPHYWGINIDADEYVRLLEMGAGADQLQPRPLFMLPSPRQKPSPPPLKRSE